MPSKLTRRVGAVAAVGLVAAGGLLSPAEAGSGPHKIHGGAAGGASVTRARFQQSNCTDQSLNGIDGQVIDISGYAGRPAVLNWTATASTVGAAAASSLTVVFFTGGCQFIPDATNQPSTRYGDYGISVPGSAKWIVVTPNFAADVTVTLR